MNTVVVIVINNNYVFVPLTGCVYKPYALNGVDFSSLLKYLNDNIVRFRFRYLLRKDVVGKGEGWLDFVLSGALLVADSCSLWWLSLIVVCI